MSSGQKVGLGAAVVLIAAVVAYYALQDPAEDPGEPRVATDAQSVLDAEPAGVNANDPGLTRPTVDDADQPADTAADEDATAARGERAPSRIDGSRTDFGTSTAAEAGDGDAAAAANTPGDADASDDPFGLDRVDLTAPDGRRRSTSADPAAGGAAGADSATARRAAAPAPTPRDYDLLSADDYGQNTGLLEAEVDPSPLLAPVATTVEPPARRTTRRPNTGESSTATTATTATTTDGARPGDGPAGDASDAKTIDSARFTAGATGGGDAGDPATGGIGFDTAGDADGATDADGRRLYTVEANDSFWLVARKTLGAGSQWKRVADANDLPHDAVLQPGQKLVIPDPLEAEGDAAATTARPEPTAEDPLGLGLNRDVREVTVQDNQSLWDIAAREYGDGTKWRVIYQANRDRLADADTVRAGQKLRIPPLE